MYLQSVEKNLTEMNNLKINSDYSKFDVFELAELKGYSGVWELKFKDFYFKMLNIYNDDSVPLKFFWKDKYEQLSLNIWYELTRNDNKVFFDVGAHTGIYSIIGNLNKKVNTIISLEPYFINYTRMLSNFKLNDVSLDNSFLVAASNSVGNAKFMTRTSIKQHTSGGRLEEGGNHTVKKIKLDNFNLQDKKVGCIKIDTEGHELNVLIGSENIIKNSKPEVIFELNFLGAQECIDFLTRYGYEFFIIDDENNKLMPIGDDKTKIELRNEGTNCLATINPSKKLFAKYIL